MLEIKEITAPEEKSKICDSILPALPDWFGIEESIVDYVKEVGDKPFYCAFDGGKAIGFVSIKVHNPYTADIYVTGILSDYHRQGIGRKLVEVCEDFCRNNSMEFLTVKTLAETHPDPFYKKTRLFYEAMGFKPLEVFPLLWDEYNPCLLMVKYVGVSP